MDVATARTSPDDGSATGQSQRLANFEGTSDDPLSLPQPQTGTETTRSRNELFCKITLAYLEETAILLDAEKLCEEWNIAVEPPEDPTLTLDIKGFHKTFGRLSEITDQGELQALRKYAVRNMDTLGVLHVRQQPRLCQLDAALLGKCEEWDSSMRSSYDAVRDLLDRETNQPSLSLGTTSLRVARLAFTAFTQSIRDFEPLEAMSYRLALQVGHMDDIERDEEEQEHQAERSRLVRDLDERIARLSRHVDEVETATDEGTTNDTYRGHPDDNSSPSLFNGVESDDPHRDTGTDDYAVSDDGKPTTPSLTQSGVSGEEGTHDVVEKQISDDGVQDLMDESTPHPPKSSSLKMGKSWADVDDDADLSANDSSATGGSANRPLSYAAAVTDGQRPPSIQPAPITPPAIRLTSVATATVSPRPCDSSRRDCPHHILQRPPDIAGGATASEPRRHDSTLSCAPTALTVGSMRAKQNKKKKKRTDSKGRQNVGDRQGNGAPATAVFHDDRSDNRSHHSSVPAAGPRQETPSSASHENELWPAASRNNSTQQGRGALVNDVTHRSAWGQTVERRLSLKILQLTSQLDQVQQRSVLDSALARREIEMLVWKIAGLRQEIERLRIELSGYTTVHAGPCYDVDDDLTVAASNCSGDAMSVDVLARAGAPSTQTPQEDVDATVPTIQGGIGSSILDTVPDTALQTCVVTINTPAPGDVTVVSRTDQGRATTTELDLGHASSAATFLDQGREQQTGAAKESADPPRDHPTDRGRAESGQLQDLDNSTPPPKAIRQTTSTDGLQDIEGLPKPKRKRRRGKRRRKGKGKTRRRPGHSLTTKSSSNDSVSNHCDINSSQHADHCKARRHPARHSFKAVGARRQQSLFKEAYTGYIPSSGFHYRKVQLSPTSRPMFVEGRNLKPAKDVKDQNLREPHAKEVSLEPLDWTGVILPGEMFTTYVRREMTTLRL